MKFCKWLGVRKIKFQFFLLAGDVGLKRGYLSLDGIGSGAIFYFCSMGISIDDIKILMEKRELPKALLHIKEYKAENGQDIEVLLLEVDAYSAMQEFGKAINVLNEILTLSEDHDLAKAKKEQIETILKFINLDIYANPNLSHDPWD